MSKSDNQYSIQHKIRTVAALPLGFDFEDFRFSSFEPTNINSNYWLARKTVSGRNSREAYSAFVQELIEITDALSVICHCAFSLLGSSYLVDRLDDSFECFFAHIARTEQTPTVVTFTTNHTPDLQKLVAADCKAALHFLRECNIADTAFTGLAMAICTAEELAGPGEKTGKCEHCNHPYSYSATNEVELAKVLEAIAQPSVRRS